MAVNKYYYYYYCYYYASVTGAGHCVRR